MQKLKRYFVVPYLLACVLAIGHTLWMLVTQDEPGLAWYGALVALVPMLGFMVYLGASSRARTSEYMLPQLVAAVAGVILVALDPTPVLPVLYALVLGLGGVSAYIFWYSRLDRESNPILSVGNRLPEFELEDTEGNAWASERFLGSKLLLVFYRGNWCPLCVAQVKEIADQYRELERHGVQVAMVSPQPHKQTRELAKKFDVPIQFFVDRDNRAASKLQLLHKDGIALGINGYGRDTVLPTVVITDETGIILYVDLTDNYRLRPEPSAFFDILETRATHA